MAESEAYEKILRQKAKENLIAGGGDKKSKEYKSGLQNSAKLINPIDTREELASALNVSHDTLYQER